MLKICSKETKRILQNFFCWTSIIFITGNIQKQVGIQLLPPLHFTNSKLLSNKGVYSDNVLHTIMYFSPGQLYQLCLVYEVFSFILLILRVQICLAPPRPRAKLHARLLPRLTRLPVFPSYQSPWLLIMLPFLFLSLKLPMSK